MSNKITVPAAMKEEWKQSVDKVKEAATSVGEWAGQSGSTVGGLASQAASDVTRHADNLTTKAGAGIHELGDRLGRNSAQSGMFGDASQAVARTVRGGGEYLEDAKLSGLTKDLTQLIRRNPVPSVLVAVGLVWFVARKLRS